ncbi:MAG: hypothetical protein V4695_10250 [Pseudomonadota bacterium]
MRLHIMLLAVLLSGASGLVTAQQDASPPTPPTTTRSSMTYDSAFADYRPMQEIKMVPTLEDWRAANDTVGRMGGHAGVLKDGASPDAQPMHDAKPAPTSPQNTPVVPSKPSSHQGH